MGQKDKLIVVKKYETQEMLIFQMSSVILAIINSGMWQLSLAWMVLFGKCVLITINLQWSERKCTASCGETGYEVDWHWEDLL